MTGLTPGVRRNPCFPRVFPLTGLLYRTGHGPRRRGPARDPVPGGTDPDNECPTDVASGCQRNGFCNGSRSCALYASGTVCQVAVCSGQVSNLADTCNGTGTCVDNGTRVCFPYICATATGLCKAACTVNSDCQTGYDCAANTCKKSKGQGCGADAACSSGFCTDSVCCEARCGGVCEKCNLAARVGFCDAVAAGADPDDECPTDPTSTCGRTGVCSGARACAKYAVNTVCTPASCSGQISNLADTCDGNGTCVDRGTQTCTPYICDSGTGLCRASCSVNTDCQPNFDCAGGTCKKSKGQTCATDTDCASNFCTDSVCCEARCNGVCEKCNLAARAGFCDAVSVDTDPDNECAAQAASTCGTTGMCSGSRSCALHPSGTVCNSAACAAEFSG